MVDAYACTTIAHTDAAPAPAAGAVHLNVADDLADAPVCVTPPEQARIKRDVPSVLRATEPSLAPENDVGDEPENTAAA